MAGGLSSSPQIARAPLSRFLDFYSDAFHDEFKSELVMVPWGFSKVINRDITSVGNLTRHTIGAPATSGVESASCSSSLSLIGLRMSVW
jgi:hypothetical protein